MPEREVPVTLGVTLLYGLVAGLLVGGHNSGVFWLLVVIGYIMLFAALLQKFGGRSVKIGLRVGLISILGAVLGWLVAVGISGL